MTSFIEKDWYAVQLLYLISSFENNDDVQVVFSGGTSLSKGFNIIRRFSEDLDFVLIHPQEMRESQRRDFRKRMVSLVKSVAAFKISDSDIQKGNKNKFFKAEISYERTFENSNLRPYLQLEMTFSQAKLDPVLRPVRSIISELSSGDPDTYIHCMSPVETAANKLSALSWRILARDRVKDDDRSLVRHVYDLSALQDTITNNMDLFLKCVKESFEQDFKRGGEHTYGMTQKEILDSALNTLKTDGLYPPEYKKFVINLLFPDENRFTDYHQALQFLDALSKKIPF